VMQVPDWDPMMVLEARFFMEDGDDNRLLFGDDVFPEPGPFGRSLRIRIGIVR
jgi:hypothetical protein